VDAHSIHVLSLERDMFSRLILFEKPSGPRLFPTFGLPLVLPGDPSTELLTPTPPSSATGPIARTASTRFRNEWGIFSVDYYDRFSASDLAAPAGICAFRHYHLRDGHRDEVIGICFKNRNSNRLAFNLQNQNFAPLDARR
jgi:hypothetical protein